jgi:hypothetical protein
MMHPHQRQPRRRRERFRRPGTLAQTAIHARSSRIGDTAQVLQPYARLFQRLLDSQGHIALMSFLSVQRLNPSPFLEEVGLLEHDVGEDLTMGGDY